MSGQLGNNMDVPYESDPASPRTELDLGGAVQLSGGVVVMAAVTPVPEIGPKPTLVFRFARPDGTLYPPIALITDDDQLAKLRPLIQGAIADARRAAREAGG